MPELQRPDGVIQYEVHGEGYPVLLFAPGGLRSSRAFWGPPAEGPARPWVNWVEALPALGFTAVAMDQRNAGESVAEIRPDHGWHTYAADHLALMDHLGFERFHVLGGCIGGSFCLMAAKTAPERVTAAVLQNPIGFNPAHPEYFQEMQAGWSAELRAARPELDEAAIASFGRAMWEGDFVFCVDREFARACPVPTFLLPGNDIPHPAGTSVELATLLSGVTVVTKWRAPEHLAEQKTAVLDFLKAIRHERRCGGHKLPSSHFSLRREPSLDYT